MIIIFLWWFIHGDYIRECCGSIQCSVCGIDQLTVKTVKKVQVEVQYRLDGEGKNMEEKFGVILFFF